jgi:HlyD family secretion protein
MKRLIIWLLILVVVIGGGIGTWLWIRRASAAAVPAEQTAKVVRGDIKLTISSTGKVVSNLDVDIKTRASGQVLEVPFDISQAVKTGDLLISVDPTDANNALKTAQAALVRDQAKLDQAKQDYLVAQQDIITARLKADAGLASAQAKQKDTASKAQRMKALYDEKLESQEDWETADTAAQTAVADEKTAEAAEADLKSQELSLLTKQKDITVAEATVTSDQVSVDDANTQLGYCKQLVPEYPPTAGDPPRQWVVSARTIQVGTVIQSAISNVSGGSAAITLSDMSRIFVLASVDESDIGNLREAVTKKFPVTITADAYPGKFFSGEVNRIATTGVNTSNVVTFEVKIEVTSDNKDLLKPTMTANVDITAADEHDVLLVPVTAVSHVKKKFNVTVVGADGSHTVTPVTTGLSDIAQTEITSGLTEGQTVVVGKATLDSKWSGNANGPGGGRGPPG